MDMAKLRSRQGKPRAGTRFEILLPTNENNKAAVPGRYQVLAKQKGEELVEMRQAKSQRRCELRERCFGSLRGSESENENNQPAAIDCTVQASDHDWTTNRPREAAEKRTMSMAVVEAVRIPIQPDTKVQVQHRRACVDERESENDLRPQPEPLPIFALLSWRPSFGAQPHHSIR